MFRRRIAVGEPIVEWRRQPRTTLVTFGCVTGYALYLGIKICHNVFCAHIEHILQKVQIRGFEFEQKLKELPL